MKITVITDTGTYTARVPYEGADHVLSPQVCCGKIMGGSQRTTGHDTIESDASCACGKRVGKLRVKLSTIFGIEEDQRVLNGRCRVY